MAAGPGFAEVRGAGERRGLEVSDSDVARVPAVELHHVVVVRAERREHLADLRHRLTGLGHEVAGMQHLPRRVDWRLRRHENHPAAADSLAEGRGQGRRGVLARVRARRPLAALAAHRVAFDLDLQAFVGEVRHGHRGDGGVRARWQAPAYRREEPRLVDAAVVHVEAEQGDEILEIAVELFEHSREVGHRPSGLRGEIAGVAHHPVRGQVHLTSHPHHLAAAHAVLVGHVDGPVPVTLRPRMSLLHHRISRFQLRLQCGAMPRSVSDSSTTKILLGGPSRGLGQFRCRSQIGTRSIPNPSSEAPLRSSAPSPAASFDSTQLTTRLTSTAPAAVSGAARCNVRRRRSSPVSRSWSSV